jgi:hypothetical protein
MGNYITEKQRKALQRVADGTAYLDVYDGRIAVKTYGEGIEAYLPDDPDLARLALSADRLADALMAVMGGIGEPSKLQLASTTKPGAAALRLLAELGRVRIIEDGNYDYVVVEEVKP